MSKWKDKWFYYKVGSAFLILGGLFALYLYHMIAQTWVRELGYPFSYWMFQGQFFSFFTFQSNFIVGVWFLVAAIYHKQKNHLLDNQKLTLAVTSYISVTCFVYVVILFPGFFISHQTLTTEEWITGPYFHLLNPALMIAYSLTHVQAIKLSAKSYYSKYFFFYLIYPLLYILYLIFRIVLYRNVAILKDVPFYIVYPYFVVLNPDQDIAKVTVPETNDLIFIGVFLLVALILFAGFNLIYFFSFKKMTQRK
ncbi:hypothetical protein [Spiroplasma platyhelix]|uniref:Pr6Pr family membrane protein n=1 Tax=Spiroplasma platyhelix PALS-1 TaxID=1276218 RepID=A0A846UE71_9MOLU|nr:hypothetical protein [Spiroplasma platyhelix]MBE4704406.1 hypothetical protein [Spiroplasma platyhelix PALS-1]NKE38778.1 hypothetical protein [Spiroplasma platyhelix PALS-1]UJB28989.1 hypothetical protein SPLAT_v1c02240 [Spiroplasma platyhelix PALS-1]